MKIIILLILSHHFIYANELPPMPDPQKNATLLGVDSDKDGVRDDVQIWIEKNYSTNKEMRLALRQYAEAMQKRFSLVNDKEKSIQGSIEALKAVTCMFHIGEEKKNSIEKRMELFYTMEAFFNNTKERSGANSKASENFSGQVMTMPNRSQACKF